MSPRATTMLYWGLTLLFCLLMLMDGVAGLMRVADGQVAMRHLGYPMYMMSILGTAKVLGALALLQPWGRTLREWAFAGFAINFIGAAASHLAAGDGLAGAAPALVMLVVLLGLHYLARRYRAVTRQRVATPDIAATDSTSASTHPARNQPFDYDSGTV